jgi:hypothetical protein
MLQPMLWRYLRAFVAAFREAQADARRRPLTLENDTRLALLRNLLPKKQDRSLDSDSGASE